MALPDLPALGSISTLCCLHHFFPPPPPTESTFPSGEILDKPDAVAEVRSDESLSSLPYTLCPER